MCIIFLAINTHPTYPLIIASNRDEFLDRPTEPMSLWDAGSHHPRCTSSAIGNVDGAKRRRSRRTSLAGRDLVAGGTWLGLDVSSKDVLSDTIQHVASDGTQTSDSQTDNSVRWIALTNYIGENNKEDKLYSATKTSRGGLLTEYLQMDTTLENDSNETTAESFAKNLCDRGEEYNGCWKAH